MIEFEKLVRQQLRETHNEAMTTASRWVFKRSQELRDKKLLDKADLLEEISKELEVLHLPLE